jgi:hypothetical protein
MTPKFELWVLDERGVVTKPRDRGDHTGFCLRAGSIRGWARIERREVLLIRTDVAEPTPKSVMRNYVARYPNHIVKELHETRP